MKNMYFLLFSFITTGVLFAQRQAPAYPLVTHDPYFSIWSMGDTINAQPTEHWTGANQSLLGMVKVDGKTYRF